MSALSYSFLLSGYNLTGAVNSLIPETNVERDGDGNYVVDYALIENPADLIDYSSSFSFSSPEHTYWEALTTAQETTIDFILKQAANLSDQGEIIYQYSNLFSDVANIRFSASSANDADIMFAQNTVDSDIFSGASFLPETIGGAAYGYTPEEKANQPNLKATPSEVGSVFFNSGRDGFNWGNIELPSVEYWTILHETAHSLGLNDFEEQNEEQNAALDNQQYSIMSYNIHTDVNIFPSNLQLLDIAALQEIYGRNYDTRNGETTYSKLEAFSSDATEGAFVYTIWDGGGVDSIRAYDYDVSAQIDLRQGHFSSIGYKGLGGEQRVAFDGEINAKGIAVEDAGNLGISYYTIIENATGTAHDDQLIGNAWDNILNGAEGDDILYGDGVVYDGEVGATFVDIGVNGQVASSENGSGNDILRGGAGDDTLIGGHGSDTADYSLDPVREDDITGAITRGIEYTQINDIHEEARIEVKDGYGDLDTLVSIENVIGTDYMDSFLLTGTTGTVFDGGDGADGALYRFDRFDGDIHYYVDMVVNHDYSSVYDKHGRFEDSFINFESVTATGQTLYIANHENEAEELLGNLVFSQFDNGGLVFDYTTLDQAPSVLSKDGSYSRENTSINEVYGSNNGDDYIISETLAGVYKYDRDSGQKVESYSLKSGMGNDNVVFQGSGGKYQDDTVFHYRGGHDTITLSDSSVPAGLNHIQLNLWEGISQSDVTGFSYFNVDADSYSVRVNFNIDNYENSSDHSLTIHNVDNQQDLELHFDSSLYSMLEAEVHRGDYYSINAGTATFNGNVRYSEELEGTWGDDTLTTDALPASGSYVPDSQTLYGLGGDDTLSGQNEGDILSGGFGNDIITGSFKDQSLYGDDGDDTLYAKADQLVVDGGNGDDTIYYESGLDTTLNGGSGDDTFMLGDIQGNYINGGDGFDTVDYSEMDEGIEVAVDQGKVYDYTFEFSDTISGIEHFTLSNYDDVAFGSDRSETFYGLGGNDEIYAGGGNDTIIAGSGEGDDFYVGGEGFDRITYTSVANGVLVDFQAGIGFDFFGTVGFDSFSGFEGAVGGAGNDVFISGHNDEVMEGGLGDDTYNIYLGHGTSDTIIDHDLGKVIIKDVADVSTMEVVQEGSDMLLVDTTSGASIRIDSWTENQAVSTFEFQMTGETFTTEDMITAIENGGSLVDQPDPELPPELLPEHVTISSKISESVLSHDYFDDTAYHEVSGRRKWQRIRDAEGTDRENLTLENDHNVRINFVSEEAWFKNTLGVYEIAEDGSIDNVRILSTNTSAEGSRGSFNPGDMIADLGTVSAGTELGFFMIKDGFTKNKGFKRYDLEDGELSFQSIGRRWKRSETEVDESAYWTRLQYESPNGTMFNIKGAVFHATVSHLNYGNREQTNSGLNEQGNLQIAFEDNVRQGDGDFNDLVFEVVIEPVVETTLEALMIAETFTIKDDDDHTLASVLIDMTENKVDTDQLLLDVDLTASNISLNQVSETTILLTGEASVLAYQDILHQLSYASNAEAHEAGVKTVSITITDIDGLADISTIDIVIGDADSELLGTAGVDVIVGTDGDDFISSGFGNDVLTGNLGHDWFVLDNTGGVDTITDFTIGEDVIDIRDVLTNYDPVLDSFSDFVEITDDGVNSTIKVDQDGSGTDYAMVDIAMLEGVAGITDEDVLVINGSLAVS